MTAVFVIFFHSSGVTVCSVVISLELMSLVPVGVPVSHNITQKLHIPLWPYIVYQAYYNNTL